MELPHLHVLRRHTCAQRHAHAITGIDVGISGRGIDPARTARREDRRLGFHIDGLTRFDADGDHTHHRTILVLHQINGKPLIEEDSLVFDVVLIKRVQQRVTCAVGRRASTGRLATLAKIFRLPTKRSLVDAALLGTRERQAHVLQLEDRLGTDRAHVLNSVLIADVVRTFNGVVHVPAPVVLRVSTRDCAGNAALRRHGV